MWDPETCRISETNLGNSSARKLGILFLATSFFSLSKNLLSVCIVLMEASMLIAHLSPRWLSLGMEKTQRVDAVSNFDSIKSGSPLLVKWWCNLHTVWDVELGLTMGTRLIKCLFWPRYKLLWCRHDNTHRGPFQNAVLGTWKLL